LPLSPTKATFQKKKEQVMEGDKYAWIMP